MKRNYYLWVVCWMVLVATLPFKVTAQPLSAYTNFQDNFMVWDNGVLRKIETLPPQKIAIGRIAIAYIDDALNFKIFSHGGTEKINSGFTQRFYSSDNLVLFQNAKSLNVWDQGKITNLSKLCDQFYMGDSLVVFFEGLSKEYRAYYNGRIYPIESFLAGSSGSLFAPKDKTAPISAEQQIASGQLPSLKVSNNTAAYVNYANQFRIFYKGQIIAQEEYLIDNFDVGKNTVAYVDANQEFKIFHNGKTLVIDQFAPVSYQAGNDIVAFVTNDYNFKVFYNDSLFDYGYLEPDYILQDNVLAFEDGSRRFKVFYKGRLFDLDNYFPGVEQLKLGYNSLAYIDAGNVLRLFSKGKIYDVTNAKTQDWELTYDVLKYRFGHNMYKIFYRGKTY